MKTPDYSKAFSRSELMKMRKRVGIFVTSLVVVVVANVLYGQGDGGRRVPTEKRPNGPPLMRVLDKDRNGQLSATEINNATKELWLLDKNKDERVTMDEVTFIKHLPPFGSSSISKPRKTAVERLLERDTDKDGKLSQDELGERFAPMFGQVDENRDGLISKEEIEAAISEHANGDGEDAP